MPKIKPKVLAVDDEIDMLQAFKTMLGKDYHVLTAGSGKECIEKARLELPDLALLDIRMPKMDGIETLKALKEEFADLCVIIVTASRDIKPAVECIKLGAYDYLTKPFELDELKATINKALEHGELMKENARLKTILKESEPKADLIGETPVMKYVLRLIDDIAKTDSTVLITGESGTGKELAARAIHKKGKRRDKPFLAVNCAAIPDNLLESELFGFEAGAFTGALEKKLGKFELASGGTLFLDEIGCMSQAMQAKMLRAIEEKRIDRIGGASQIPVDVRIVAASNIDFRSAVAEKKFREDLYYRLNVIPLRMPSLKERREDTSLLIEHFLKRFNREMNKKVKGFSSEAVERLIAYEWPGNVRELMNVVERAVALSKSEEISLKELSLEEPPLKADRTLEEAVASFEKTFINSAISGSMGNHSKAAKSLGLHRTTLLSKMQRLKMK